MGNMSYCRFRNTLKDLQDCQDHFHDTDLSPEEAQAMTDLKWLMKEILEENGYNVEDEEW